jgi:hypothetical protein
MDYFPLAQTTPLGLMGGRIGVVQMGSAYKANKILGDVVLLVPENQHAKRRRNLHRNVSLPPLQSRGSISKLERLRGEKFPVEPLARGISSHRMHPVSMAQISETMEDNYGPSVDHLPPITDQKMPSLDQQRTSMEGKRTSTEGRSSSFDQRMSVDFNRPKSKGAVWII